METNIQKMKDLFVIKWFFYKHRFFFKKKLFFYKSKKPLINKHTKSKTHMLTNQYIYIDADCLNFLVDIILVLCFYFKCVFWSK